GHDKAGGMLDHLGNMQPGFADSNPLGKRPLWSAIIESPRRKWVSSQTAHMACRAKHHWTTTLLAVTIARNDASVLGGCPAYAEYTAPVPSLRTGGMDTAGTCGEYRALRAAVSASIGRLGGRKSLPAQTTRPVPGAPYQTPACYRCHPLRLDLARA